MVEPHAVPEPTSADRGLERSDWVTHPYSQGLGVNSIQTLQTKNGKPLRENRGAVDTPDELEEQALLGAPCGTCWSSHKLSTSLYIFRTTPVTQHLVGRWGSHRRSWEAFLEESQLALKTIDKLPHANADTAALGRE